MTLKRFGQQGRELRHPRSDIETPPAARQLFEEGFGEVDAQSLTGFALRLPELIAAFVAIDRPQRFVIEPVEEEANGLNDLSLKSAFHLDDSLSKLVMEGTGGAGSKGGHVDKAI